MTRPDRPLSPSGSLPYRQYGSTSTDASASTSASATSMNPPGTAESTSTTSSIEELGLSAWIVCSCDSAATFQFVSESFQDILGYTADDLLGTSVYRLLHPDEIPMLRKSHYQALTNEKTAVVSYFRVLHRDGHYVECCCSYYTVYNMQLALYTRAVDGQRTLRQALTAREVTEVIPTSDGKFEMKRWSKSSSPDRIIAAPPGSPSPPIDMSWDDIAKPSSRRTFYMIDRFTDTSRVIYVSNDSIINASSVKGHSFYSIIRPSDRAHVRKYIEAAKESAPILLDQQRSGGHGYTTFHVLKIPDLPPSDSIWPQGTDNSERSMPGQEFILVEGIFTASSDGLACIIEKIERKPPSPDRRGHSPSGRGGGR